MALKQIFVYADWLRDETPVLMGELRVDQTGGHEVFSFDYDKNWLRSSFSTVLDPDLQMYSGPQYLSDDKINFGLFLDSSPDRWGRVLMRRREAIIAKLEERPQRTLMASDYLLGVYDEHRMGALRFKTTPDGVFHNENKEMAAPPWTSLRDLESASLQLEKEDSVDSAEYLNWLNLLIAPGSSIGGARPKASVIDVNNHLWIAKFPSIKDDVDVSGWEMVAHELALQSGIEMAPARIQKFSKDQYTFMTKRFDREKKGARIHFSSAMTLLGMKDGDDYESGASYLDIAGLIIHYGARERVKKDLEQLWRRIVFSICVKNTDDHLRNHGFLLGDKGWQLSPAYDINPVPYGTGLTLNISDEDNSLNLEFAKDIADFFALNGQV